MLIAPLPPLSSTPARPYPAASTLVAVLILGLAACAPPSGEPPEIGIYKVGNPYEIEGVWYYPAVDETYDEVGMASWYGAQFHGRQTANGEVFDMNKVSAAHRTLPMPSMVEVTNLQNGRTITARVNDRGPFARNRVLDLSRRGAQLLGFERAGTARVRVRVLPDESRVVALEAKAKSVRATPAEPANSAPRQVVKREDLAPPNVPVPAETDPGTVAVPAGTPTERFYVQAGAFADRRNADRLRDRLSDLAPAHIVEAPRGGRTLYKVRLGPAKGKGEADRLRLRLAQAGVANARVVAD
ncbi:MAG: septal ring lytic transglycosylase RlpA family protein [Alphaproteobacteria bacterium]|nr:septal ring lytic transglycosylase RlpA family protein [Alphaproteobacteria bacterium]